MTAGSSFLTTGIPACLWFLTRDKTGRNLKHDGRDRRGETLFVDARKLGTMQTRTLRVLTGSDDAETLLPDGLGSPKPDTDIGRIVYAFRQWRGEPAPAWWDEAHHGTWAYRDIPGFCKRETIEGIAATNSFSRREKSWARTSRATAHPAGARRSPSR